MNRSDLAGLRKLAGQAAEDYLKAIFEIAGSEGRATTNQIAEKLGVRPASVTGMLQRLATLELPLVIYNKHRGVELTLEGKKIAIEIIRHHRLLELFLHDTLGYNWDEVHQEADLLEHFISEKFEERIAAALGNPVIDPHGDPIPTQDLVFPEIVEDVCSLHVLRPSQKAVIYRVKSDDAEFLRELGSLDLLPGTEIEVAEYFPLDDLFRIVIGSGGRGATRETVILKSSAARQIQVRLMR